MRRNLLGITSMSAFSKISKFNPATDGSPRPLCIIPTNRE